MNDIDRLLIERACERLIQQYCHLTDHGRAAEVADLFAEDAVWSSSANTMNGRERIRRGFQKRQEMSGRMSRHVCTSVLVEVMDDTKAESLCYLTLYRNDGDPGRSLSPAGPPALVGEYRDRFTKTSEGWRFQQRRLDIFFMSPEPDAS